MDLLIALVVLIPVVLMLLMIIVNVKINTQQRTIEQLIESVNNLTRSLNEKQKQAPVETRREPDPIPPAPEPVVIPEPIAPTVYPDLIEPPIKPEKEPEKEPFLSEKVAPVEKKPTAASWPNDQWDDRQLEYQKAPQKPSWLPDRENLEEFIGGNLANKIGIAVLVLGIAFFVKYAIDRNWISELGRVSIGLLCGAALIVLAHRTRNRYRAFSSVLMGGGLAILYFSIAFAFHAYGLISQQAAFIILLLTTAFAVLMALYYNRQEIAILAALGGFATPFLVSTGQDNYVALFVYLIVLCAGMTILSWFRKWPAVNIICLIGTSIVYGGWLINRLFFNGAKPFPYEHALLFATAFFLLFMGMHTINNLRLRKKFAAGDFILVLSTQIGYYAAGMTAVSYMTTADAGAWFTLAVSAFNLVAAWLFYRFTIVDRDFVWLLAGLGLTFLALFGFLHFEGHQTTLFWSAQAVLLHFMFARTQIKLLFRSSILLQLLSLISLIFLWADRYSLSQMPILFNQAFITTVGVSFALFLHRLIVLRYRLDDVYNRFLKNLGASLQYVAVGVVLLGGLIELCYQINLRFPNAPVSMLYAQMYVYAVLLGISVFVQKKLSGPIVLQAGALMVIFSYLFLSGLSTRVHTYLHEMGAPGYFVAHWISALLAASLVWLFIRNLLVYAEATWKDYRKMFTWLAVMSIIVLLSAELYHINHALYLGNPELHPHWQNLYFKAQLSILWGLCSFVMIWLGLRYRYQPLRVISLVLFTITLAKLFLYDIRNIPPGGKIASFILLGVLLLTVSFMYQRIRAMLVDPDKDSRPEQEKK